MRATCVAVIVAAAAVFGALPVHPRAATQEPAPPTPAAVSVAIDQLGSFDFPVRTQAARTVRRAPAATTAPLLTAAAKSHKDSYVRYRALVLLTALGETPAREVVRGLVGDRDDRLRTVAYQWYEHHPDPAIVATLVAALANEQSEFVRPALTRALAAHGSDAAARDAMRPLVMRGADLFRGAAIAALGDYKGTYALPDIIEVAKLDGPLQEDAITAIGLMGDASARPLLASLQKSAPMEAQPTISGALCLLGIDCPTQDAYLKKTLTFAATSTGYQPLLRGVVHAMAAIAARGRADHLTALLDAGVPSQDPTRESVALGVGLVALRDPELLLRVVEGRKDRDAAIALLRDAFDRLAEDFEEEQFYVVIRRAYWAAPAASPRRQAAQALIDLLEF